MKTSKTSMTSTLRDRVRDRAKKREHMGGLSTLVLPEGVELYKPEKGRAEFDILPYKVTVDTHPEVKAGEVWYERTYLAHRNVGPDEQFLICPRTIGKKCPICEEHHKLSHDPDADEDVVAGLRAKERELFNVVLKDGKGEVQILDISTFLFGQKLEEEVREGDEANATFPELKGGKTLKVRWEEQTMGKNKFVEASRIDFADRDEDYDDEVLTQTVDLDKAMKILSYEEIAAIFNGGETTEAPAEEAPPTRTLLKRAPVVEEEEPAEEEQPKKTLLKKRAPEVDDDDELPGLETKKKATAEGVDCMACDGTGKTTKGKVCPICNGSGKEDEDEPAQKAEDAPEKDDDEKETEETVKRTLRRVSR